MHALSEMRDVSGGNQRSLDGQVPRGCPSTGDVFCKRTDRPWTWRRRTMESAANVIAGLSGLEETELMSVVGGVCSTMINTQQKMDLLYFVLCSTVQYIIDRLFMDLIASVHYIGTGRY